MGWYPHFDNNDWVNSDNLFWDGSGWYWTYDCDLSPIGTWYQGFRSTKFRMTFTSDGGAHLYGVTLKDTNGSNIFSVADYVSGAEVACSFGSYDIAYLALPVSAYNPRITNIEFLVLGEVNIGDVWKEVKSVRINIGGVWKTVSGVQINIGDVWKTVF